MSSISKTDIAAAPNLLRCLSAPDLAALGLSKPTDSSPKPTLKGAFDHLSPAQKKRLRGTEAKQHGIICNWLLRHKIPFIHAPTSRKVVDLPPGWPDFTIFRQSPPINEVLLIEIKVPGGQLSWEQKYWIKLLCVEISPSAGSAIKLAADFCSIPIPAATTAQSPQLLYDS